MVGCRLLFTVTERGIFLCNALVFNIDNNKNMTLTQLDFSTGYFTFDKFRPIYMSFVLSIHLMNLFWQIIKNKTFLQEWWNGNCFPGIRWGSKYNGLRFHLMLEGLDMIRELSGHSIILLGEDPEGNLYNIQKCIL